MYRESLNLLFRAAAETIVSYGRKNDFLPSVTEVMHTFGSKLEFHPHIHMLLSEGGIGDNPNFDFSVWKECRFFPHLVLKERFKYNLIKSLRSFAKQKAKEKLLNIPAELKQIWQKKLKCRDFFSVTKELYKVIWYVHIGEKLDNASFVTRYIGRYAKRPCISETKILDYSFEKQIVKFLYHDKVTNTKQELTLSVDEFLKRLIRHIPDKNFRMIRYYGLCANAVKNKLIPILLPLIAALYTVAKIVYEPKQKTWRERITESTGTDPLVCPYCKNEMSLVSITCKSRAGPLKTYFLFR